MGSTGSYSMGGFSLINGFEQASVKRQQGQIQNQIAQTNARFADIQAADAIDRGATAESKYRDQVKRVIGEQRASYAGQGVDVDSGSAATVQDQTAVTGEQQALQIRSNAWKEAWGYRVQAQGLRSGGSFAEMQADNEANNTLITGGMKAFQYGAYGYSKQFPTKKERKS